MSKQGDSPNCEYRRQLRECAAAGFHARWCAALNGACKVRYYIVKKRLNVMEKILIVEDDAMIAAGLTYALEQEALALSLPAVWRM